MKSVMPLMFILTACTYHTLGGEPVLSVLGGTGGTPAANSCHGWVFTVNQAISVTHLGLYDGSNNGMEISHPIGVFRLSDSVLLTSGTISAGTGNVLLDGFRYVDTPDVTLAVGETYVISYYSATDSTDLVFTAVSGLSVKPAINLLLPARWQTGFAGSRFGRESADTMTSRIEFRIHRAMHRELPSQKAGADQEKESEGAENHD